MANFNSLQGVDVKGKTLLVRVDLNSSIDAASNAVQNNSRFAVHASTLKQLAQAGAKVVVLAHQGRPGDKEFRSLREHGQILSAEMDVNIQFVSDICGPTALERIQSLSEGQVLLLENLRYLSEEVLERPAKQAATSMHVEKLSAIADLFVNDAFSVSHRSQASIVGFPELLPNVAGPVMQRELNAIDKLLNRERDAVYLLGGLKLTETMHLITSLCHDGKAGKILLAGAPAFVFLAAKKVSLGDKTLDQLKAVEFEKFVPLAHDLLVKHGEVIVTPIDVAVDLNGKRKEYSVIDLPVDGIIRDIGSKTISRYAEVIKNSETVFARGVPGEFEKKEFALSTRELGAALVAAKAFTVVGGGAWSTSFKEFKLDESKISHVSLSGGALLEALSGKPLPGIEALKR